MLVGVLVIRLLFLPSAVEMLIITNLWPELLCNVTGLFDREIKAGLMTKIRPAVTARKLDLEKTKANIAYNPRGSNEINL